MSGAQQEARHQQVVEELCAAAIRALSGEADLHFRARRLHRGRRALPLFAPHLHPSLATDDFGSFRGAADGLALRLLRSDAALHEQLRPDEPVERLVFELLEQIRVEALVPAGMRGVASNLRHRYAAWSRNFHRSGLTDSARGLLLYTVAQVCRARVTNEPVLDETEDLMEATRAALAPLIGHALAGLRRDRHDQVAYAAHALAIARTVAQMLQGDGSEPIGEHRGGDEADAERAAFSLLMDLDAQTGEPFTSAVSGHSRVLEESAGGYRIFTTAYDRELHAAALVRPELLREYRDKLDARIAGHGVNIPRLARELRALLAQPAYDGWDSAQEEGRIDGRRIAQLISSPTERRLFRSERIEPHADCIVTWLIDCSGSMKEHAEPVAMIVDIFVRALEQAGVTSEILGFTTRAWNGGRALRDWRRAGAPPHPGRLNEQCHLVFKDAETAWRRARPQIAALLKPDLFREGIDGEAVRWACGRLRGRPEARKLLLVVSDGSPMDSATNLANDAHYLDQHLVQALQRIEQAGDVQVFGVGVGLDLSPYYGASLVLDIADAPSNPVFRELLEMIAGRHRR